MSELEFFTKADMARAWDEGHRTRQIRALDDCQCGAYYAGECGCGKYGTGRLITPNPYRTPLATAEGMTPDELTDAFHATQEAP